MAGRSDRDRTTYGGRKPTESLRREAARRGVSVAQVRGDRGEREGLSRSTGQGHPVRTEAPVSTVRGPLIDLGVEGMAPIHLRRGGHDAGRAHDLLADEVLLLRGDLAPATWDSRWGGHRFGGVKLPSADDLLARAERGEVDLDRLGTP